jgi:hypothetical protein
MFVGTSQVKCVKYWPEKDSHSYDEVRVKLDSVDSSTKELTVRIFSLEHAKVRTSAAICCYLLFGAGPVFERANSTAPKQRSCVAQTPF